MKTLKILASILLALLFASCESGFDDMLDDADLGKAALKSVTLSTGSLGPEFKRGITSYNLFAGNGVTSVTVTVVPENSDSIIRYRTNGGTWADGSSFTVTGISTTPVKLEIQVTSGDGEGVVVYSFDIVSDPPYRVTYISLGATVATKDIYYPANTVGTLQPAPVRNSYCFTGWWTQATGGTQFTATTVVSANTSVYAQWQAASSGLSYTLLGDDTYSVAQGTFTTGNLIIPDYYNGKKVTVIANGGFDTTTVTGITFGNNITLIDANAFEECDSLTSVTIPDNVITINSDAFFGCSNLVSVVIGNGVTSIAGTFAFAENYNLTTVTIGSNVNSIGSSTFQSCSALKTLNILRSPAPTTGTNTFLGITSCTLHIRSTATGYTVAPWTTTTIFSSIVKDL